MWLGDLLTFVYFSCDQTTFRQLLSTFRAARRPFVNLHQHSVRLDELLSRCTVNSPCGQYTFRQLPSTSVRLGDLPSTSHFSHIFVQPGTLRQLPLTFGVAARPFVNFRQLSMWPGDLLSTSVNFHCGQYTFRELLSTFCTTGKPSVNFC